jgi:hypothetical protein
MHHLLVTSQSTQRAPVCVSLTFADLESQEQRLRILHLTCCLLPKADRDTTDVLFLFLKWVASFSHIDEETGCKIDLSNLATVICPNMVYDKGRDPNTDESFRAIRAVSELLQNQGRFSQVRRPFLDRSSG